MDRQTRTFEIKRAVRARVPLFISLFGASGSGKTLSSLLLAEGIQSVFPGDIVHIDTENKRATHYADQITFEHVDFQPPFGSLDYVDVLRFAGSYRPSVIIVDSMSHEHEGQGGMVDFQEQELLRMITDPRTGQIDWQKANHMQVPAWVKPKAARRVLLNELVRFGTNLIICFRAKETTKPVRATNESGRSRMEMQYQGFTPIGGSEFIFEMTMSVFLPPGSEGIPRWQSEFPGEKSMIKLPKQFRHLFQDRNTQLSAAIGRECALWAAGDTLQPASKSVAAPAPIDSEEAKLRTLFRDVSAINAILSPEGQAKIKAHIAERFGKKYKDLNCRELTEVKGVAETVRDAESARRNGSAPRPEPAAVAAGGIPGNETDDPFADN